MVLRLFLCMLVETLKLLVMYSSMLCEFDCKFWERRDNFSSLDSPYNFVFKSKLKLTIKNNVPKPEQYSEFFNQVTTINLLSLSQSFGWSLTQWREGYLLPTWAWITLTTFQLNAPVIMPWWWLEHSVETLTRYFPIGNRWPSLHLCSNKLRSHWKCSHAH